MLIGMDITKAQKERTSKILREWYDSPVRFDGVVTTRRKHIGQRLVGKKAWTETHAKRKVNGCYAKLNKPRIEYTLVVTTDGLDKQYIDCPKTVFDETIAIEL